PRRPSRPRCDRRRRVPAGQGAGPRPDRGPGVGIMTMPAGTEERVMGPISYLIVEFPGNKMTGEGFPILVDLVDRGVVRILDLLFVRRDPDGSMSVLNLQDVDLDGRLDMAVFAGVSSGILDSSDLADAAAVIEPGSSAGILIFENTWA